MILDIGCGPNKLEVITVVDDRIKDWRSMKVIGIDHYAFPGVDIVRDLRRGLPFADNTFEGAHAKHILEHFDGEDLIFIVEELWRVCKPNVKVYVEVPGLGSPNCGKDFTHKKKDWDEWSFQMWQKVDVHEYAGEPVTERKYIIERGPMYGIRGEFISLYNYNDQTQNAHYELTVIKDGVKEM